jgi:hypothetical protein
MQKRPGKARKRAYDPTRLPWPRTQEYRRGPFACSARSGVNCNVQIKSRKTSGFFTKIISIPFSILDSISMITIYYSCGTLIACYERWLSVNNHESQPGEDVEK